MKVEFYTAAVTAMVDTESMTTASLGIELDVEPALQSAALAVLPAHLRRIADDLEAQANGQ